MCRAAGWARGAAGGTRRGAAGWVRGAAGWQAHLESGLAHVVCQVLLVHDHLYHLHAPNLCVQLVPTQKKVNALHQRDALHLKIVLSVMVLNMLRFL